MSDDSPTTATLRLCDLSISVGERYLLRDTTVQVPAGKITVIVGGSGAGKSVLLRVLAGLIPRNHPVIGWRGDLELETDSGTLGGSDQTPADPSDHRVIHSPLGRHVGVVFQQFALFDELSTTANVQFAIDHRNDSQQSPRQSAVQWLDELGVPSATPIAGLSGGQKQRLAIARTLAADPEVVFYDEPTSGLDAANGRKVAALIRQTQSTHRRTSIVVTHDYTTLIPIADEVLFLDSHQQQLVVVPRHQWNTVDQWMEPIAPSAGRDGPSPEPALAWRWLSQAAQKSIQFFSATGNATWTALTLPYDAAPLFPRWRWAARFWLHFLRLVGGPSAWLYLILAGLIAGFTTTYFTFRFLPFRLYTQPLLIDELLASIGFALYRILVPILATILIAARCGAAVAADVGVKQYGGQIDAMRTLGIRPQAYLLVPAIAAFLVATPLLEWLAFSAARLISMITFLVSHPGVPDFYWQQHFFRNLRSDRVTAAGLLTSSGWVRQGALWVLTKNILCGVGTAAISYHQGIKAKQSTSDVSDGITATVLWTTLFVLFVHFFIALIEF